MLAGLVVEGVLGAREMMVEGCTAGSADGVDELQACQKVHLPIDV